MSSGHTSKSYLKAGANQAVAASQTKQVVSEVFRIGAEARLGFRCDLTAASTTVAVAITAMLQTSHDGTTWVDGKTTAIAADGNVAINYLPNVAGDQAYLPLRPLGRIAITSGAGDATTISQVWVSEVL